MVNELTETEKAYLAGFIDGEGCIHISTSRSLFVIIAQTNKGFLQHWQEKVGLGKVYYLRKPNNVKWKDAWQWHITGYQAVALLKEIRPYLEIKQAQADVALRFGTTLGMAGRRLGLGTQRFRDACRVSLMELKKGRPVSQVLEIVDDGIRQLVLNI